MLALRSCWARSARSARSYCTRCSERTIGASDTTRRTMRRAPIMMVTIGTTRRTMRRVLIMMVVYPGVATRMPSASRPSG